MKVKEVVVKKSIKMSINYNTIESSVIMTAELDEGDNEEKVYKELSEKIIDLIYNDIKKEVELIDV